MLPLLRPMLPLCGLEMFWRGVVGGWLALIPGAGDAVSCGSGQTEITASARSTGGRLTFMRAWMPTRLGVCRAGYSQTGCPATVPVAPAAPPPAVSGDHIAIDVVDVVRDAGRRHEAVADRDLLGWRATLHASPGSVPRALR